MKKSKLRRCDPCPRVVVNCGRRGQFDIISFLRGAVKVGESVGAVGSEVVDAREEVLHAGVVSSG